mmetsp:Transcript_2665/g.8040  ORF Transcript_2665/g.8040 Transcript_2665/m.8040 type:complete len:291 (-) Transcript_2665:36-908(-)
MEQDNTRSCGGPPRGAPGPVPLALSVLHRLYRVRSGWHHLRRPQLVPVHRRGARRRPSHVPPGARLRSPGHRSRGRGAVPRLVGRSGPLRSGRVSRLPRLYSRPHQAKCARVPGVLQLAAERGGSRCPAAHGGAACRLAPYRRRAGAGVLSCAMACSRGVPHCRGRPLQRRGPQPSRLRHAARVRLLRRLSLRQPKHPLVHGHPVWLRAHPVGCHRLGRATRGGPAARIAFHLCGPRGGQYPRRHRWPAPRILRAGRARRTGGGAARRRARGGCPRKPGPGKPPVHRAMM